MRPLLEAEAKEALKKSGEDYGKQHPKASKGLTTLTNPIPEKNPESPQENEETQENVEEPTKPPEESVQVTFSEPVNAEQLPTTPKHVRRTLAEMANVSEGNIFKIEKILKEAKPEDIEAIERNEKSINRSGIDQNRKLFKYYNLLKNMDKLNSLLKGKDHFYIMHLSYGDEGKCTIPYKEHLWILARGRKKIGLSHYLVEGAWNDEGVEDSALANGLVPIWRHQFDLFYNHMRKDDIVVILAGWDSILGVAKVTGEPEPYDKKEEGKFFSHTRKVRWIKDYDFDKHHMITPVKGFINTLHMVEQGTERWTNLMTVKLP